jgi:hypothetical protein
MLYMAPNETLLLKENAMFKTLEAKWNARTPVYLHNGTKENLIFQLALTILIILGFTVKDKIEERRMTKYYEGEIPYPKQ